MTPAGVALSALLLAATAGGGPDATWFRDATVGSGIPSVKYGEGACLFDLDGDGLPELFLPVVKGKNRLFANRGNGRFEDVTDAKGVGDAGGIGAVIGDLDGDGLPDLYVVRGAYPYGVNLLYRQWPDGVFRVVPPSDKAPDRRNGIAAVLGDVDGDGRPDLFVANWGVNALLRNRSTPGEMRLEDETRAAGLAEEGRNWGALFTDLDGDGKPDLLVLRGGAGKPEEPKVYINRGDGTFEDRSEASGIRGPTWSLGAVSADFDGDGDLDLFVTGYDGDDRLFRNDGGGRFTDVTATSGIRSGHSVGAAAGCVDGDLLPDLVVAGFQGPVKIYRNLGGLTFGEMGARSGILPSRKNEGVVLADIDDDGDLDLYVANYEGENRLYRNTLDDGRYLKVRAETGGRAAVGAVARLYRPGRIGERGALLATLELSSGHGFCSQGPAELLFRVPDTGPYDLRVTFPGGAAVDRKGVMAGRVTVQGPGAAR